jgi:hypothetical protein
MADDGRVRNGDLEALNKHISSLQTDEKLQNPEHHAGHYPDKGRIATDGAGRRVIFDNVNGHPKITDYEVDEVEKEDKPAGPGSYGKLVPGQNLFCAGNRTYSNRGRENYDRAFSGKDKDVIFDDPFGFWSKKEPQKVTDINQYKKGASKG